MSDCKTVIRVNDSVTRYLLFVYFHFSLLLIGLYASFCSSTRFNEIGNHTYLSLLYTRGEGKTSGPIRKSINIREETRFFVLRGLHHFETKILLRVFISFEFWFLS